MMLKNIQQKILLAGALLIFLPAAAVYPQTTDAELQRIKQRRSIPPKTIRRRLRMPKKGLHSMNPLPIFFI